jgi:hypothetical protein
MNQNIRTGLDGIPSQRRIKCYAIQVPSIAVSIKEEVVHVRIPATPAADRTGRA